MPADVSGHCTPGPSPDKPRRSVHRTSVSDHGSQLTVAGLPVRPGRRAPGSTFDRGAALSQDQWTSAVTASATRSMPLKIHLIDRREVRRWRMAKKKRQRPARRPASFRTQRALGADSPGFWMCRGRFAPVESIYPLAAARRCSTSGGTGCWPAGSNSACAVCPSSPEEHRVLLIGANVTDSILWGAGRDQPGGLFAAISESAPLRVRSGAGTHVRRSDPRRNRPLVVSASACLCVPWCLPRWCAIKKAPATA